MDKAADHNFSASNEMLLELCKRQDQEALRVLFRRYEKPVYNLLYRMLSNREDAEEALAEVFVKVWRAAGSFRGGSKFTTWLYRITSNTARDFLRSRMTKREVLLDDTVADEVCFANRPQMKGFDPEDSLVAAENKARISKAMSKLSEEDRLLISLYHFQELDYEEISKIANVSPSNLKVKLFRARQRLKKLCVDQDKDGAEDEMQRSTTDSAGLRQGACECSSGA
ncbi:MAG: RNA polymerase sigma factor [Armatimonadetes bacterium]|nr:RNA polymerase sigma factor [Armatimonadota bacterium]